jgi:hypothetical protein
LTAAALSLTSPAPLQADPLVPSSVTATTTVVFPFTVHVTTAFGPLDILFGRSFAIGDTLSGRVTFDGNSGPDHDGSVRIGSYLLTQARVQLDVPSGFALDASNVDFQAATFDNLGDTPDELIFNARTCCHETGIGFVGLDVLWTDPLHQALTSDVLPTDPRALGRFSKVNLGLLAGDNPAERIGLFGEAPVPQTPTPEPASVLLLGVASVTVVRRRIVANRKLRAVHAGTAAG